MSLRDTHSLSRPANRLNVRVCAWQCEISSFEIRANVRPRAIKPGGTAAEQFSLKSKEANLRECHLQNVVRTTISHAARNPSICTTLLTDNERIVCVRQEKKPQITDNS